MSDASDEMVFGRDYRALILALGLTPEELAERTIQTVEWARAFLWLPNSVISRNSVAVSDGGW